MGETKNTQLEESESEQSEGAEKTDSARERRLWLACCLFVRRGHDALRRSEDETDGPLLFRRRWSQRLSGRVQPGQAGRRARPVSGDHPQTDLDGVRRIHFLRLLREGSAVFGGGAPVTTSIIIF